MGFQQTRQNISNNHLAFGFPEKHCDAFEAEHFAVKINIKKIIHLRKCLDKDSFLQLCNLSKKHSSVFPDWKLFLT